MKAVRTARMSGVKRSVELQHGRRGAALMLRRGLHGAKNWVLEPEDGMPRRPTGKTVRALVVLTPAWVVLSAVTGGPERGGQGASVPQACFLACVITLAGLAWLSARERRLGREKPWEDLGPIDTVSDETTVHPASSPRGENRMRQEEKPQVSGPVADAEASSCEDNRGDFEHSSQTPRNSLHDPERQATSAEAPTLVAKREDGLHGGLHEMEHQAISEEPDAGFLQQPDALSPEAPTQVLPVMNEEPTSVQVVSPFEGLREADPETPNEDFSGSTESDATLDLGERNKPLPSPLQDTAQGAEISLVKAPVAPLQERLQVVYASPGPYEPTPLPLAEDWWLTRPDEPSEEASEEHPEGVTDGPHDEDRGVETGQSSADTSAAPGPTGSVDLQGRAIPEVVLRYLASQSGGQAFTETEKETARTEMIEWAHGEWVTGRLTQTDIARMLGVNKSTVGRWLKPSDPWGD